MKRMWSKNELKNQNIELLGSGQVPSIKGGEIIEKMSGYDFAEYSKENLTIDTHYTGIVKNGNKLTIVDFLSLTRSAIVADSFSLVGIYQIPSEVGAKLYPYTIQDSSSALDYKKVYAYTKAYGTPVLLDVYLEKTSNTRLQYTVVGLNNLEADTEYVIRLENTFLLSDNLASQE